MSASDSDYSIDWLASDEEEYDSAVGLSPDDPDRQHASLPQTPSSSSSSSSSSRDSTTAHVHSGHIGSTTSCDSKDDDSILKTDGDSDDSRCGPPAPHHLEDPWVTETQGYAFVGQQQRQPWGLWTTSLKRKDSVALSGKQPQTRRRSHSPGRSGHRERPPQPEGTEEDRLFALKCEELQCYIPPLSSILRGLQSGRYSERLSSFQESVAIDRIQRIKGVLQNPNMGERYISIILKMEDMLHSWFPHVKAHRGQNTDNHKDDSTPAKKQKQFHGPAPPAPPPPPCSSEVGVATPARHAPLPGLCPASRLKRFHTPLLCSSKAATPAQAPPPSSSSSSSYPPPARLDPGVTQDSAVSSSTDPRAPPRRGAPPFKISSPCLERLLKAKESIITPRSGTGGGRNEKIGS